MTNLKDNGNNKARTIDIVVQLIIAALIPLALLVSSSLVSSAGLSFLQSLCLLVGGPATIALLLSMAMVDLLFFHGAQNQPWPSTNLQISLLVVVTIAFRAYLL